MARMAWLAEGRAQRLQKWRAPALEGASDRLGLAHTHTSACPFQRCASLLGQITPSLITLTHHHDDDVAVAAPCIPAPAFLTAGHGRGRGRRCRGQQQP